MCECVRECVCKLEEFHVSRERLEGESVLAGHTREKEEEESKTTGGKSAVKQQQQQQQQMGGGGGGHSRSRSMCQCQHISVARCTLMSTAQPPRHRRPVLSVNNDKKKQKY